MLCPANILGYLFAIRRALAGAYSGARELACSRASKGSAVALVF